MTFSRYLRSTIRVECMSSLCQSGEDLQAVRHILILIHSLGGGGAERVTINLARQWVAAGNKVTIVTLEDASGKAYELPSEVRYFPLDMASHSGSMLSGMINNVRRARRLRTLLRYEAPDIVIGMMTTAAVLLALTRNGRMLAIGAERSHPPKAPTRRPWSALRRWCYWRLDTVVALTSETANWLRHNTNAPRVDVIPNPVHLPLPRSEPTIAVCDVVPKGQRILLGVGRLSPEKYFDRLIRAYATVAGRQQDWTLVLLGEGPSRAKLEEEVRHLGLEGRVCMPGRVGNLGEWYQAADLLSLTSQVEGFPNVLIEAMAHGCPVLSVDCEVGPRHIITSGENGILVPQDDPCALAEALERLMADKALRAALAARALEVNHTLSLPQIDALWQVLFALKPRNC